jgi:hypothetical protein
VVLELTVPRVDVVLRAELAPAAVPNGVAIRALPIRVCSPKNGPG